MSHKLQYDALLAYAAGDLPAAEVESMQSLVAQSPEAADTVRRMQTLISTMRTDDSVAAPVDSIQRAVALFGSVRQSPAAPGVFDALKRIFAELVFDSRPKLATAGIRGGGSSYQLAFECELAEIDLEIERSADSAKTAGMRVMGQISPTSGGMPNAVVLARSGTVEPVASAHPDEAGVFRLISERGKFDLLVSLGDTTVVLPEIEIA